MHLFIYIYLYINIYIYLNIVIKNLKIHGNFEITYQVMVSNMV